MTAVPIEKVSFPCDRPAGCRKVAIMPTLTTIGFDADDTLWQNEQFFRLTEAEKRNLAYYSSETYSILYPVWLLRRAAGLRIVSKGLNFPRWSIVVYSAVAGRCLDWIQETIRAR